MTDTTADSPNEPQAGEDAHEERVATFEPEYDTIRKDRDGQPPPRREDEDV